MNPSPTAKTAQKRASPDERGGERDIISFAIYGSYKVVKLGLRVSQFRIDYDPEGHAIPKLKKTGAQFWTPEAKRYVAWKTLVVSSFLKSLETTRPVIYAAAVRRVSQGMKPIPGFKGKAHMTVNAYYKNHKHPDTENVFGSVADALFENDNNLVGTFDFEVGGEKTSMVISTLNLPENLWS